VKFSIPKIGEWQLFGKRSLNHAIDFQNEDVAVYAIFGSTSCQGSNASKSSMVLARGK
jgi:hypothetical protein